MILQCPKINRKCVLYLLKYTANLYYHCDYGCGTDGVDLVDPHSTFFQYENELL